MVFFLENKYFLVNDVTKSIKMTRKRLKTAKDVFQSIRPGFTIPVKTKAGKTLAHCQRPYRELYIEYNMSHK